MPRWMKWAISLAVGFAFIVLGWRLADSRWFSWLLPTFFVVNCLFLIVVVLLQSGKAADIAGAFGGAGSQTAFGPRGAATVLSRATTWCAIMFMVCAMALVLHIDKGVEGGGGSVFERVTKPKQTPAKPQVPAQQTPTPQPQTPAPQSNAPQSGAPQPRTPAAPANNGPATQQPNPQKPSQQQTPAQQPPAQQQPTQQPPAQKP
jgi:preprotein translocase subunit SecG